MFVFVSSVVREDGGNACCHQNQRVQRKKELNQVQSYAFKMTPGHKQADSGDEGGQRWRTTQKTTQTRCKLELRHVKERSN